MQENLSAGARVHRDSNEKVVKIFNSFNFSDLTVRSTRIPDDANIGDFVDWELFYLAANQLALATNGVLVRGGICIGDLFVRAGKTMLFGPALVKAYKLESEYAVYPRIIIDRDLIWEAEKGGYICRVARLHPKG
jgi:hypothetical protein